MKVTFCTITAKRRLSMNDIQRFKFITEALEKRLKGTQASEILDISYIHFLRLKKKVKLYGINGLLRKNRQAHNKKIGKRALGYD